MEHDRVITVAHPTIRKSAVWRNWKAIEIIWYREILRYLRDWVRIITSLVQPLALLLVFGSGLANSFNVTGGSLPAGTPGVNFQTFLYPGVIGMAVLFAAMESSISVVSDREFGFLHEMLVAPVSRASIVLGKTLGGSTVAMVQGALILVFAPFIGISLNVGLVITLMLEMLVLAFSTASLGILIASLMQSMESYHMVQQFILMPMFFLSGAFFPLNNIPGWLAFLSRLDPVTYGVDPLRQAIISGMNLPSSVIRQLGLGVQIFGTTLSVAAELAIVVLLGAIFVTWAALVFGKQK
jgi:ABC-2 type transport system permease protein